MSPAAGRESTETTGPQHQRDAVQRAAAELFSTKGFVATGVREIAAQAGVDPALVIRYFGSKEKLFLRTMTMSAAFADVVAGPLDSLGERIVEFVLERTRGDQGADAEGGTDTEFSRTEHAADEHADDTGGAGQPVLPASGVFAALMRASGRPMVRAHLAESVEEMFVGRIAGRLPGPDAELRARLVSAQLTGLMAALYVVEDPMLNGVPQEDIVRWYGRAMQLLLDG